MQIIIKEFNLVRSLDTRDRSNRQNGMSLVKRIKRHIIGPSHDFFAVTLPGFERLCADEIAALSDTVREISVVTGGVSFKGRLADLYRANLHVRTAGRFLMRIARFKATNFQQLEKHTRNIAWELYLPQGAVPELRITAHRSRLYHSGAIAQRIGRSIAAAWTRHGGSPSRFDEQTVFVRLEEDAATLSLDSSGAPLYQRGLKTHAASAPLRETTAAAILMLAGYQPERPLLDPMCGAGTFSLEAALMVKKIPPGLFRAFAFMQWPGFRPQQWAHIKKTVSGQTRVSPEALIWASDSDDRARAGLDRCVRRNNLEDTVNVAQGDFFALQPEKIVAQKGLVVLNPPYGRRLSARDDARRQYEAIAAKLTKDFKGWKAALLVPEERLARGLNLSLKPRVIRHGGLHLTLLTGTI